MISPFTGGNATLRHERRSLDYRKERYDYVAQFYEDDMTKECFTTEEQDEASMAQVFNQYRVAHGIPFTDEIAGLRKTYGLSAARMSAVLGFGANQYRQYEEGAVPTESNGKLLKACLCPQVFREVAGNARGRLSEKDYARIIARCEAAEQADDTAARLIFKGCERDATNGFAPLSATRLHNILLFVINRCGGVFPTKMNKLLFYADFCHYRKCGQGLTGLTYRAIQYGPVPFRWNLVYGLFDDVCAELVEFSPDVCGTRLTTDSTVDVSELSGTEQATLSFVCDKFADATSRELSLASHGEEAWRKFVGTQEPVDYALAFSLKAV